MPRAAEVFLALVACFLLVAPASAIYPDQLPALINQVLAEPQFNHSDWGIQIVTKFPNGTILPLFSNNPSQFFVPASNNKVPTTAAAFLYLGPDFHVQTPVYGSFQGSSSSGFLQDLCLVGQGDASIFNNKQLYQLVRTLTQRYALSDIDQLSVDDSTLPASFPTSWEWMDLVDTDGAQPNSLIVNENALTLTVTPSKTVSKPPTVSFNYPGDQVCIEVINNAVTVGFDTTITEPLTIGYVIGKSGIFISGQMLNTSKPVSWSGAALSPAERFGCLLKYEFNSDSVFVNKSSVQNCNPCKGQPLSSCSLPANQHLLATIPSPALKITMNHTLQESDNLFAEAFLRLLGLRWGAATGSKADAFSAGLSAVISLLSAKGVDTSLFKQYDGSGLSRHNLMSPEAMVQIFSMMYDQPNGDIYRSFLPVAGESGSLKNRMVGTTAQGVIHAKTGTMTGVNSLSGYMINDSFPTVVFSIIVNDSNQSSSVVRPGIDQICVYLSQLQVPPSWSL